MHIALITRVFDPTYGGLERFQVNLAKELSKKKATLTVICEKWDGSITKGMNIVSVKPLKSLFEPKNVRFAKAVQKHLECQKFDCIFSNTPYYPCDIHRAGGGVHKHWYQLRAQELGGLYQFNKYLPRYRASLELEKNIFDVKNVAFQVANSELVKAHMLKYYGYPDENIKVIYNGIDFRLFSYDWCKEHRASIRKNMNILDKDFVILFPSNNHKRKGLDILVDAVRKSPYKKDILLLVIGREMAKVSGIRLRFEGHQADILPYYAVSDSMILPTIYEPCSNVVLEAMACGVIPVTSPSNGASELIDHEKNGYVLRYWNDKDDLKQIIEKMMMNRTDNAAMGCDAKEKVKGLTLGKNADEIYKLCKIVSARKQINKTQGMNT